MLQIWAALVFSGVAGSGRCSALQLAQACLLPLLLLLVQGVYVSAQQGVCTSWPQQL